MSQSLKEQLISLGFESPSSRSFASPRRDKPLPRPRTVNREFTPEMMTKAMRLFKNYMRSYQTEVELPHVSRSADHTKQAVQTVSHQADKLASSAPENPSSLSLFRIGAIDRDAKLNLSNRSDHSVYALRTEEDEGIDSRFDDDGSEVTIGLDFGTSSVKTILKIESEFVAVPFVQASGIDAYLLPTELHEHSDGSFTLSPDAPLTRSSIKLDLLAAPEKHESQVYAVIFLALVLRHIRSWFFSAYSRFDDEAIAWECAIGYPSTENDSQTKSLWRELLYRSWMLSVTPETITLDTAESVLFQPLEAFEDEISFDYFRTMPEVVAAIVGFNRNQPAVNDFKGNYTLVDIGSGTVDVSTFAYTKTSNQYSYNRTQYTSQVEHLGTTNCHHYRLASLTELILDAFLSDSLTTFEKARLPGLLADLDREKKHALLKPLPESVTDYLSGVTIEPMIDELDEVFSRKLTELIGKVRKEAVSKNLLTTEDVAQMPIFLCGGGSRSLFYRNAFMKKHRNITWLAPRCIFETHVIKELSEGLDVPIAQDDYDRLLVAYGLCAEEPPKDFEATPLGDQPLKEFQPFIDKDMV